jgi:prevent-host-death family protein
MVEMTPQTATSVRVGVRQLRDHLSRYLEQVAGGSEVVVTDRGRPVARIVPAGETPLDRLVGAGLVRAPLRPKVDLATITRVRPTAPVSPLVADQRR